MNAQLNFTALVRNMAEGRYRQIDVLAVTVTGHRSPEPQSSFYRHSQSKAGDEL